MSYGLAIIVITVALASIALIAFRPQPSNFCASSPGFSCNYISINSTGILTAKFSQALGQQIIINGASCADQQGSSQDAPRYGNIDTNSLSTFYPAKPLFPPGNIIYSGSSYIFYIYCYRGGAIAKGSPGTVFSGFMWLNYTLPSSGLSYTQEIASFSTQYS
jgi:hypothetical protein